MATEPSGILVPAYDRPDPLSDWDLAIFREDLDQEPNQCGHVVRVNRRPGLDFH